MISIILIEPENSGNIGAVARVMKNFGFKDLVLINPKSKINQDSRNRAKHAQDILDSVKIKDFSYLKNFHTLIATTSKLGSDYNVPRSPILPDQLSSKLSSFVSKNKIGIVFGRESSGLTNEEINLCDFSVSIPASSVYPSLNLSHSVAIICYELFKFKKNITSHFVLASDNDKKHLLSLIDNFLDKLEFSVPSKKNTQKLVWKKVVGKSFLTKREAFALMGFFKKL